MKRFEEKNERLDQIGGELLKASVLKDEEIEKIVAAPHLFDSIKATIRLEQKAVRPVWGWQKSAAVFAAVAVFAIGAFWLINFAKQYYVPSEAVLNVQNQVEPVIAPQPSQIIQPPIEHYETQHSSSVKTVVRNDYRNKPSTHAVKKESRSGRIEEVSEFYAVTYTGDADESDDDQIVRVELPRSSLFAMGINVPVENEVVKVKADLLIGSDGVMKAVRLVR
jgi:hypothetical protein